MSKQLRISNTVALPVDAVTSTLIVYGGKGMGKTNLASVLVEECAFNHLRFAVIDPMGVWWGLRHDESGKGAGIPALIFGGIHGDLPIEPTSGADVADFVADENESVIIDISRRRDGSMWSIAERVRFVTAYAKRLYQRQGEKRRPIMQVIDEAARFAPQMVRQGEGEVAACMGAIAVLVEEGRNVGIGVTLVTQRSARLNKDVAELADCMIAFRIVGPNSMRAVLDWLGEHVDKNRLKEIGEQLRSLPRGSALVVSPGWLEYEGIAAIRKRKTFDSSKTPEAGKDVRASGVGAKPDLAKYAERFAKTIEDAKANDPKALKARVAELERELAKKPAAKTETKTVEKAVIKEVQLQRLGVLFEQGDKLVERIRDVSGTARQDLATVCDRAEAFGLKLEVAIGGLRDGLRTATSPTIPATRPAPTSPAATRTAPTLTNRREIVSRNIPGSEGATPSKMERAMLIALVERPDGLTRKKIRIYTGYADSGPTSKGFARLIAEGWADVRSDVLVITDRGRAVVGDYEPLPKGDKLRRMLLNGPRLSTAEKKMLAAICDVHPSALTRPEIRERTGYADSGPTSKAFAHLVGLDYVIDEGRSGLRAAEELFG